MELKEHPLTYGVWDTKNPSPSFKVFASHIHENAKDYLLRDKVHAEMLLFMKLDGSGKLVLCSVTNDERDELAQWVRDYIDKHYFFGVVHVCESWVRLADKPNDHIFKQIEAGEMKVSELKPEHRMEALSVSAQCRDGFSVNWIDAMVRDTKENTLKLGKCHLFNDFDGRFGKLFG